MLCGQRSKYCDEMYEITFKEPATKAGPQSTKQPESRVHKPESCHLRFNRRISITLSGLTALQSNNNEVICWAVLKEHLGNDISKRQSELSIRAVCNGHNSEASLPPKKRKRELRVRPGTD